MLFELKGGHEMEGGWGLVWNSGFGSMISHTHSTEIRFLVVFNTLAPDSCEHCPPPVDRTFKLSTGPLTLQLCSTVRVPLHKHNFFQYNRI